MRNIPATGINLFQLIYILIREYEEKSGKKALNLSLGNPDLIPDAEILSRKARFSIDPNIDFHTYAEDKNLNGFCEGLLEAFTGVKLKDHSNLRATPIAGIKTATGILPLACGLHLKDRSKFRVATHLPAYDVMGTWVNSYLGTNRVVWPLRSEDGMKMRLDLLPKNEKLDLIFVIRPGNPASSGATAAEWKELIEYCIKNGTRLANDGAYATLTDGKSHIPLSQIAKDYPELEWAELFSVSKSFSDPGQRLGVLVGSKDFVEDFILIKGNTDSGPVPVGMAAYADLFKDQVKTKKILLETYSIYRKRLDTLVPLLKGIGLKPACETTSGFFTLWLTPDSAFGIDLHAESIARGISKAELFNRLVIERTGIVGVHFSGTESFIRYAVCTDVLDQNFQTRFKNEIAKIQPFYI